jgi:hypothetical protein
MDISTRTGRRMGVWSVWRAFLFSARLPRHAERRHFPPLLFFNPAQRPDCWGVDRLTLDIEYRAVTRAIAASFKTVPVQVTADMGAACRVQMECP